MTEEDLAGRALKPDTINTHLNNVYPALAMLAGMQLEVFTALGDEALTVAETAARLDVLPRKLQPLLYALVTAGLLLLEQGERFRNTPEAAEFLVKGRPRYLGSAHQAYSDLWASTLHTAASIRSGQPQARHDFSRMSQPELAAFVRGLDAGAGATARRLDKSFGMGRFRHLLDAGGGSGGLAVALCELCPALRATVAELPNVAPITRDCIAERRSARGSRWSRPISCTRRRQVITTWSSCVRSCRYWQPGRRPPFCVTRRRCYVPAAVVSWSGVCSTTRV